MATSTTKPARLPSAVNSHSGQLPKGQRGGVELLRAQVAELPREREPREASTEDDDVVIVGSGAGTQGTSSTRANDEWRATQRA